MRITNNYLYRQSLANLQRNLGAIEEALDQVASGRRIRRVSDDPVDAGEAMRASGKLRALEQYKKNIGAARTRLSAEEAVLEQLGDALSRARELAIGQAGSTADESTRAVAKAEVDQLLDLVIQLANTEFQGSYLFGGARTDVRPIDPATGEPTDPTQPPEGERRVEIGSGQLVRTTHDAKTIFLDTGAIEALRELSSALEADDGAAIRDSLGRLEAAFDDVQVLLGDVGARSNALDVAEANVDAWAFSLTAYRSDLTEVEFEEAVTRLVNRSTALQAALMANSRILQTALTDYLR